MRTPVYNPGAFINQALFIQRYKYFPHCLGASVIHSKSGTVPIAGSAQLLLLLYNAVSVLVLPCPDSFKELLPTQIVTAQTLFLAEFFFYFNLRCDTCMVSSRQPERIIALHPLKADQCVLQGCIHSMTHVELTGNIWWGHNDCERFTAGSFLRMEVSTLFPHAVNSVFYLLRFVNLWQFSSHNNYTPLQMKMP